MRLSRRSFGRGIAALVAGAAIAPHRALAAEGPSSGPAAAGPLVVKARPVEHFAILDAGRRRFGDLDFIGGLDLSSDNPHFGGWSGLSVSHDGSSLLALSDVGCWLTARIVYAEQTPAGLADATIAPVLGPDGAPLWRTPSWDCEALCVADGVAYVGIERTHEIRRFDIGRDGLAARGQIVPTPPAVKRLSENRGLEAIGIATAGPVAGSLLAIAERAKRGAEVPTRGWIVTGAHRGEFAVVRRNDFDVTDLAFLPDGDMLLLERRFNWLDGVGMRIRRIDGRSIRPGASLDGPTVIEADMRQYIDNIEGLAVHRAPAGETVLTMISDDNLSFLQRTVLLQFRLAA